jgi:hypothetical protein
LTNKAISRQLFEIYVLEDELLGSISIDEINADLTGAAVDPGTGHRRAADIP